MIEYRENLHLTQKDVGNFLGKDQSQFSKMELGKTVVSYEILENLKEKDWDIDFIITGEEKIKAADDFSSYLKGKMGENWKNLNEALIWIVGQELDINGNSCSRDSKCEYELLKQFLGKNPPDTVLLAVRDMLGISQITMSEKLGVNIKKYCQLEKGSKNPDAELLGLIYQLAYCRPTIFFYAGDMAEHLLNCLWNRIDSKQQKEAVDFLDYTIKICRA